MQLFRLGARRAFKLISGMLVLQLQMHKYNLVFNSALVHPDIFTLQKMQFFKLQTSLRYSIREINLCLPNLTALSANGKG